MKMTPDRFAGALKALGITQARFAGWHGLSERALRRYAQREDSLTARKVPPSMALLVLLLERRPELIQLVEEIAATSPPPGNTD